MTIKPEKEEYNRNKKEASIAWATTILWLGFWILLFGSCTAIRIWGQ